MEPWRRSDERPMSGGNSGTFGCGICGGAEASEKCEAREMMFGLRIPFHYSRCAACGTMWLMDPPDNYSMYYPENYYSLAEKKTKTELAKDFLRKKRDRAYFGSNGKLRKMLGKWSMDGALLSVSKLEIGKDADILDVGCGTGRLLRRMAGVGFRNIEGIDPFIPNEGGDSNGIKIWKCRLDELTRKTYDVVMFHHSLEHVSDPVSTLKSARSLLKPAGKCLVRLPLLAHAWERYRTNWVQLDPPRHMWLPTEKSMRVLAAAAGFNTESVEYDSTEFQFWGSEFYRDNIPLSGLEKTWVRRRFGRRAIRQFRRQASALNASGSGDQGAFVLTKQA